MGIDLKSQCNQEIKKHLDEIYSHVLLRDFFDSDDDEDNPEKISKENEEKFNEIDTKLNRLLRDDAHHRNLYILYLIKLLLGDDNYD